MPVSPIPSGLLLLQSDQPEPLAQAITAWLARQPLDALEQDVFLVQSNGVAEWLKFQLAAAHGVCAGARFELPGSFLWRIYRTVLSGQGIPRDAPLDAAPLAWRLLRLLPQLEENPAYTPLKRYLADGDPEKPWQLSQQLARLFDQYQVFRPDWLSAWAAGKDVLARVAAEALPVPADQAWQPALWRQLLAGLAPDVQRITRPDLHQAALAALTHLPANLASALPRRVVLFGLVHLPAPTLELLAALGRHIQVILAVPNPCRYYWSDLLAGRELFRIAHRRQPSRPGPDQASLNPEAWHAHVHPLLASWGRQSRDFIRQLDAYETATSAQDAQALPRADLFTEDCAQGDDASAPLLRRVQARIRDLVPLAEQQEPPLKPDDRSIEFAECHSDLREVEVLHDRLLDWLAEGALPPREVVVMVPDIQRFTPSIHAIFGSHPAQDPRHIPYRIADLSLRAADGMVLALEYLLRLPDARFALSSLVGLLEVPALARRFGLQAEDLPPLQRWMQGSGLRWGLNTTQRDAVGLGGCGDILSAEWALRRMLLGFANGDEPGSGFAGIQPYGEVSGLQAHAVGGLASLLDALNHWWQRLQQAHSRSIWAQLGSQLLRDFFAANDEAERSQIATCQEALGRWLAAAAGGATGDLPLPLAAVREAWLDALDAPEQQRPFRSGGVTFCTLVPMRAIPFAVVCLLGMNEADFPRRAQQSDFDLMQLPGMARAGDRSRRADDRQMMLEALLSARQKLYISHAGRSIRNNSAQPPSLLVTQLKDYLAAGWGQSALTERTQLHPLQPFSRRYFEQGTGLHTWAGEWHSLYAESTNKSFESSSTAATNRQPVSASVNLTQLTQFLRQPVKHYFRQCLDVQFDAVEDTASDDEPFQIDGLARYLHTDALLDLAAAKHMQGQNPERSIAQGVQIFLETGLLPLGAAGRESAATLVKDLPAVVATWQQWLAETTPQTDAIPVQFSAGGLQLQDHLSQLRHQGAVCWAMHLTASHCLRAEGKSTRLEPRPDKLLPAYLPMLAAAALGVAVQVRVCGGNGWVEIPPLEQEAAQSALQDLLLAYQRGQSEPLAVGLQTALTLLASSGEYGKTLSTYEGAFFRDGERDQEPSLRRSYPEFDNLIDAQPDLSHWAETLYRPLLKWVAAATTGRHDDAAAAVPEGTQ